MLLRSAVPAALLVGSGRAFRSRVVPAWVSVASLSRVRATSSTSSSCSATAAAGAASDVGCAASVTRDLQPQVHTTRSTVPLRPGLGKEVLWGREGVDEARSSYVVNCKMYIQQYCCMHVNIMLIHTHSVSKCKYSVDMHLVLPGCRSSAALPTEALELWGYNGTTVVPSHNHGGRRKTLLLLSSMQNTHPGYSSKAIIRGARVVPGTKYFVPHPAGQPQQWSHSHVVPVTTAANTTWYACKYTNTKYLLCTPGYICILQCWITAAAVFSPAPRGCGLLLL